MSNSIDIIQASPTTRISQGVHINSNLAVLAGQFVVPYDALGTVVFASAQCDIHCPALQRFASRMQSARLATLLVNLAPAADLPQAALESRLPDVELLTERLLDVTHWLGRQAYTQQLRSAYFATDAGAAVALRAAARPGSQIGAIVIWNGLPGLARDVLPEVAAPTLLIAGELDSNLVRENCGALAKLQCVKSFRAVPNATRDFLEAQSFDMAAGLAIDWFERALPAEPRSEASHV